ncbi:uncharacterized protein LOC117320855 [Pecten maximus]|uniref:uncharacterized protein LOC117320855 n=1 Tax=Pecten maximus TaxID=6579 RepID=UPI001458E152|nr:uncharacterized protein LOC117320855 [Pecten maximus]
MESATKPYCCVVCSKRTKAKDRRPVGGITNKAFRKYLEKCFMIKAVDGDITCGKCRMKFYNKKTSQHIVANNSISDVPKEVDVVGKVKSPRNISLKLSSVAGSSNSTCCVCRKGMRKSIVVSTFTRFNTFVDHNIIIKQGARCCPKHFEGSMKFTSDALLLLQQNTKSVTEFNKTDLLHLVTSLRDAALKNKERRMDFDGDCFTDADYLNLMGVSKDSFDDICKHVKDIRHTAVRSIRTCL